MSVSERQNLREAYTERSREYIRTWLRRDRPLPTRYFLEQAALYQTLEYNSEADANLPNTNRRGLFLSPDPEFLHASVRAWTRDKSLEWATSIFIELGIYEHEDLVNVACALRSHSFREELQCAIDTDAQHWLSLEMALRRYARPINFPFVKSSKAKVKSAQHEYLFDAAQGDTRLDEAEAEVRIRHQRREEWVTSVIDTRLEKSEAAVKIEEGMTVKKEEVE